MFPDGPGDPAVDGVRYQSERVRTAREPAPATAQEVPINMEYKIISARGLSILWSTREDIEAAPGIDGTIADLVLATRECLVWVVDLSTEARHPLEVALPLAANYYDTGSGDIRDRILVQDPVEMRGPYVLNRASNPESKVFRKSSLSGVGAPEIVSVHAAGDKISDDRYYFIGSPSALFQELREKGFRFEDVVDAQE